MTPAKLSRLLPGLLIGLLLPAAIARGDEGRLHAGVTVSGHIKS